MKKGTNIGELDLHLDPIAVGDVIITPGGKLYVITRNAFAQPVDENLHPLEGEKAVRTSTLEQPKIVKKWDEIPEPDPAEYAAKKKAEEKPKADPLKERGFTGALLLPFTDQDLADELRRRGYKVVATKTTVVKL